MTHKKLTATLLATLIALSVCGAFIHQSSSVAASPTNATGAVNTWSQAPINPAFTQYLKNRAAGNATTTVNGHAVGLVPSTVNFSTLAGQSVRAAAVPLAGYPSSYDLRSLGKVSPVEDQGTSPACWAFATYGSLESYLLPAEWSFSENNMKNLAGFDLTCADGGNQQMSTAYLARWGGSMQSGPVTTACDPFNQGSCTDTSSCSVQQHVQNVLFLPYRANPTDNNNIKWALQNYSGVYAVMDVTDGSWNPSTAAYYYSGNGAPDHAVTIVGWNDSYPASNFASRPPGPGAFIVKNSWGTGWGQQGYFYVSYYDTQFATNSQPPTVFTAELTTNYNTNYQYDPLGWVTSIGSGGNTSWGANVFTATSNQQLSAVSFYAGSVNTQYQIYVYTDPTSGPIGGTAYTGPNGTIAMPGYHTIPLTTTVPLTTGHKFSVVIEISTPGNNQPIPVEEAMAGYSSSATAQPGQSYSSANGTSWTDTTQMDSTMNICIKAFAKTTGQVGVAGAPAVTAQGANSLDLFVKGTNSSLYDKHWNGTTWSASASLGGTLTSDPAATSRNANGLTVFVRGTDGGIWYRDHVGSSWGPWTSIGGQVPVNVGPAVCSWGGGRLDVFVQGMNGGMYHRSYTPTSGWAKNWDYLGGKLTSAPAATSRASGGITVFVRGTDGGFWYRDYVGSSWGPWTSIGGQVAVNTGPAACSWGGGRLDVFAEGVNASLYHKSYTPTSGWSKGWDSLGGALTSSPAAATALGTSRIDVFVRGTDNGLWQKTYNNGGWSGWTSIAM